MNNKKKIEKDIKDVFDFTKFLVENPKIAEKMPESCEIVFVEVKDKKRTRPSFKLRGSVSHKSSSA